MNTDYYLSIDGINGESTTEGFTGQIELSSWSWSANNPARIGSGTTGAGTGRVALTELQCTAKMSKASNFLFDFCAKGQLAKKATLTAREAGGGQRTYYTIDLEEVFVSSYSTGGSAGDIRPLDRFSLAFGKISIDYLQQDKEKGATTSSGKKNWDLRTNKAS
jgi:type VI secretion system secreted protein Hcp